MKKQEIKKIALKLKRKPESHKYDYGHIMVIAGSRIMPGAGILCCNAAMRAGAGLVTYAVKENFLSFACSMANPETMFFIYKNAEEIKKFIKDRKVSALVIGPGLEKGERTYQLIKEIIYSVKIPIILDASGLASFYNKVGDLKKAKAKLIITPHSGELSKLINKSVKAIEDYREKIAETVSKENSLICVLKGHKTIVSSGKKFYKNTSGTPAMATAGSGDVLSGIIAAFASIDDDLFEAAKYAVYIHGKAGELAEKNKGIGIIASDICENVCYIIKEIMSFGDKNDN